MLKLIIELSERFWSKVDRRSPDDCWEWTAAKFQNGYRAFRIDRHTRGSHRIVWQIENGEIPRGMHVLYSCDNPSCCNPKHLFLGTQKMNMKDKVKKKRQASGEKHGRAKLTIIQVEQIRKIRLIEGTSQRKLAVRFGVTQRAIRLILNHTHWSSK